MKLRRAHIQFKIQISERRRAAFQEVGRSPLACLMVLEVLASQSAVAELVHSILRVLAGRCSREAVGSELVGC